MIYIGLCSWVTYKASVVQLFHDLHAFCRAYFQLSRNQLLCFNCVQWKRTFFVRGNMINFYNFDQFDLRADIFNALTFCLVEESGSAPDELSGANFQIE